MLILTRRIGEVVAIGDDIRLTVLGIRGNQVRTRQYRRASGRDLQAGAGGTQSSGRPIQLIAFTTANG